MTLHLVNKAPAHSSALAECLQILQASEEEAALLLIEDGVYGAIDATEQIAFQSLGLPCFVLQEDLQARGINDMPTGPFQVIDVSGFVKLTLDYAKVQSWG